MVITKKYWLILIVGGLLLAGMISGCAGDEETPQADMQQTGDAIYTVRATGSVVPERKAVLSFTVPGRVTQLNVDVGTVVKEGDVIAQLDTAILDAEVNRAEAALHVAQANLTQVQADPRTLQLEEMERNVLAAQAGVAQAVANRDKVQAGALEAEIARAKADVQQAFIAAMNARNMMNHVRGVLDNQQNYTPANQEYYWTEENFESEQDKYEAAYDNLLAAQAYLDDLLDGPNPDQVAVAEAEVWAASAQHLAEQARYDLLRAGTKIQDVNLVAISVEQAEAALEAAKINRDKAELRVPFDGVIAEVYIRDMQYANVGQPMVLIANLDTLHVETTDLNEIDVAALQEGATVLITFDALPQGTYQGVVRRISPKSEEGAGVNFTVIIDFTEAIPEEIRWGMTAFIDVPE